MLSRFPQLIQLSRRAEDPRVSLAELSAEVRTLVAAESETPFAAAWAALTSPEARLRLGLALDVLSEKVPLVPEGLPELQWVVWGAPQTQETSFTIRAIPLLLSSTGNLSSELTKTLLGLLCTQGVFPAESGFAMPQRLFTAEELPLPGLQAIFARSLVTQPLATPPDAAPGLMLRYLLLAIIAPEPSAVAEYLADQLDLKWANQTIKCLEAAFGGSAAVLAPKAPFAATCDGVAYLRRVRVVVLLDSLPDDEIPPLAQVSFHDEGTVNSVRLGFFDAKGVIQYGLDLPQAAWETPQAVVEELVTDLRPRGVASLLFIEDVLPAMRLPDGEPEYPELSAPDLLPTQWPPSDPQRYS